MQTWTGVDVCNVRRRVYMDAEDPADIMEQMAADLRYAREHPEEYGQEAYVLHAITENPEYGDWGGELYTEVYNPLETKNGEQH